jgi:hypothetical protein
MNGDADKNAKKTSQFLIRVSTGTDVISAGIHPIQKIWISP